jgi:hypothetical protein
VSEPIEPGVGFRRPDPLRIAAHYRGTELERFAALLEPYDPETPLTPELLELRAARRYPFTAAAARRELAATAWALLEAGPPPEESDTIPPPGPRGGRRVFR